MNTCSTQLALVAAILSLSGCAMCANPFDCQYGAYGSRLPRADMTRGRVGSILDGTSAGVVTTQPIVSEGTFDIGVRDLGDGEPQPIDTEMTFGLELPEVSESNYEHLTPVRQIEHVYDTIQEEIDAKEVQKSVP